MLLVRLHSGVATGEAPLRHEEAAELGRTQRPHLNHRGDRDRQPGFQVTCMRGWEASRTSNDDLRWTFLFCLVRSDKAHHLLLNASQLSDVHVLHCLKLLKIRFL
jgi:hypothetical protein